MPTGRGRRRRRPPRRQLLLDVALVTLFLLLDMRDLWFKLRWVGPRDAFAFSTTKTLHLPLSSSAGSLEPTTTFSYADQQSQRASGWSSFLQKCESMIPLSEPEEANGFRYVLGKNCTVGEGDSIRVQELVFTSSVRVDSMAWAACELLYKHRKPPICRSPIVTRLRERYNVYNSYFSAKHELSTNEQNNPMPKKVNTQEVQFAKPGSEIEADLIELLNVIGRSVPTVDVVCVEGFAVKGSGRYTSTIYGCGSPSFFLSAFVESKATSFAQLLQDKGWLTSDALRVMGMQFLVRENRYSTFVVSDAAGELGAVKIIDHASLINFSASGSLYTAMIVIDLILLIFNLSSIVEVTRRMLWPLWKPLIVTEYQVPLARTTKLGYTLEDFSRVLQASLLRSTPIATITGISRFLSWMLVVPCVVVWRDNIFDIGGVHAFLTMIRISDLVILSVNALWNKVVDYSEKRALAVARKTYVSPFEVGGIGTVVALIYLFILAPQLLDSRRLFEHHRITDRSSFENHTAHANTFPAQQDSTINTPAVSLVCFYGPLFVIVIVSIFFVGLLAALRFFTGRFSIPRSLVQSIRASVSAIQPSAPNDQSPVHMRASIDDLTSSTAGILMRSMPPPPSPTRGEPVSTASPGYVASTLCDIGGDRLPIEDVVDIPIRARSLVRSSWALEKLVDTKLLLLPLYYLEHGIVLEGRYTRTRCGFMDIVQPLVHAEEHEMPGGEENEEEIKMERVCRSHHHGKNSLR